VLVSTLALGALALLAGSLLASAAAAATTANLGLDLARDQVLNLAVSGIQQNSSMTICC
jgi:ABC-type transporter Mla maintaining outer membrane lipid asymmetry permease subunit MlaE